MAQGIALLYKAPQKSIGDLLVDAFIRENYTFSNETTEIPLEEGEKITDHIVENPDELTVEGFISGNPDISSAPTEDAVNPSITVLQKYNKLLALKRSKEPVTIVVGLDRYTDMIITELTIPRDVKTGADLHFSMTLKRLKIVKSELMVSSKATVVVSSASDQIQSIGDKGKEAKKEPGERELERMYKEEIAEGRKTSAQFEERFTKPYTPLVEV